jgi:tetratricopeptide (TPR) repeat protein
MDRVQKRIEADPKRAPAWALRGRVYWAQEDVSHAEADFLKAIELPKLEPAYLMLAQILVNSKRHNEAMEKLNALITNSNSVAALMQLASIHEQLKSFSAARGAYEQVLGIAPNFAPALNNLAALLSNQPGELDKAYEMAKKARDEAPSEPHGRHAGLDHVQEGGPFWRTGRPAGERQQTPGRARGSVSSRDGALHAGPGRGCTCCSAEGC